MEPVYEFIVGLLQSGVLIAALCLCIGFVIKKVTAEGSKVRQYIPLICLGVGAVVGGAAANYVFPDTPLIVCIIQGAIVGVAATGLYEALRSKKDAA